MILAGGVFVCVAWCGVLYFGQMGCAGLWEVGGCLIGGRGGGGCWTGLEAGFWPELVRWILARSWLRDLGPKWAAGFWPEVV